VGEALPLELDVVLWLLDERAQQPLVSLPAQWQEMVGRLDPEWRAELADYYPVQAGPAGLLERLAGWADVTFVGEYGQATLPMRTLTVAEAVAAVRQQVREAGLATTAEGTPAEQLVALGVRLSRHLYQRLGLAPADPATHERRLRAEIAAATAVLYDGPRHARFWHWLDRFYYEAYRPWRETRAPVLAARREEAVTALGAPGGEGMPELAWLPGQNPLRYRPELAAAVQAGELDVFFWIEPLEMVDIWFLFPGQVVVALARPGEVYESFRAYAEEVAGRAKALSDPTRLLILRLIRNLSMDNTSMAEFLEVTRPTVSVHTRILREAGLIRTRHVGRKAQHELEPAAIRSLFADLQRFLDLPPAAEEE
jgi:ArsR family transcriptional regulator